MAVTSTVPRGPVTAKINYFGPPADGGPAHVYVEGPFRRNYTDVAVETPIDDIRGREAEYTLDRDAVQVVRGLPPSREEAFVDDDSIRANYYPEVEALLLGQVPGAHRVVIFDHTVRRSGPDAKRGPVGRAHIDQVPASAAMRVHKHLPPDEADRLMRGRYRIINVWRPLNRKPVESSPLAFAPSHTVDDADIFPVEHRYNSNDTGFSAGIRYNPNQKWHYLSGMTGDERLLLECFDSEGLKEGSGVQGGRLAHTAFDDPRTHPDAEGRESIEVRTLVFGP